MAYAKVRIVYLAWFIVRGLNRKSNNKYKVLKKETSINEQE